MFIQELEKNDETDENRISNVNHTLYLAESLTADKRDHMSN